MSGEIEPLVVPDLARRTKERLQLMEHPLIAQMETARLRRENRQLRRRNAVLLAGFVVGAVLGGLAAWLAPAGWFPL